MGNCRIVVVSSQLCEDIEKKSAVGACLRDAIVTARCEVWANK